MNPDLYSLSVPTFRRYLNTLSQLVQAAEQHALQVPQADLLDARLAPDMLPFGTQVEIACNFVARTCLPLAGHPLPPYPVMAPGYEGLQLRVAAAQALLDTLTPAEFDAQRVICDQAGTAQVQLPAAAFLQEYALPNFMFHLVTAYLILRSRGVPLGKSQFDGFHAYPGA
ncbi:MULTISPECIES: DUF1993 domain-containing protein [Silvimonas]|uniref:DUF1993 domain-containing protein n=1 Tax=Silvimonas TaxID=300264 RepID=UPI0024B365E6|nr:MULTISPECIES: DUF1993 domain-containing protein [Silvimonas]MDR3426513.1 DUF1993 domain-containing protein [Silvimonas sp.]